MKYRYALVIVDVIKRIKEDDISAWATKLTYYILLSIFPFILFFMELLSYTHINNDDVIIQFQTFVPKEIINFFNFLITDIQTHQNTTLFSVAILITIWSASKGILAIIHCVNKAYREKETRSYFHLRGLSYLYTIGFAVVLVITFVLLIFGNNLLKFVESFIYLPDFLLGTVDLVRIIVSLTFLFFFFVLLYNVTPNRKISFVEVIPGSLFATLGWTLMSICFSYYVSHISNLSYMYGSLTGIIILLIWLYLCSLIIMIGGELNAVTQQNKKRN